MQQTLERSPAQTPDSMTTWQKEVWQRSTPEGGQQATTPFTEQESALFEAAYVDAVASLRGDRVKASTIVNGDEYDRFASQAGLDAVEVERRRQEALDVAQLGGRSDPSAYAGRAATALSVELKTEREARLEFAKTLREMDAASGERFPEEVATRLFEANGMWPQTNVAESFGAAEAAIILMQQGRLSWAQLFAMDGISGKSALSAGRMMNAFHKGHKVEKRFEHVEYPVYEVREDLIHPEIFSALARDAQVKIMRASTAFLKQAAIEKFGEAAQEMHTGELSASDRETPEMKALEAMWFIGAKVLLEGDEVKTDSGRYKRSIREVYTTEFDDKQERKAKLRSITRPKTTELRHRVREALVAAIPQIESTTGYVLSEKAIDAFMGMQSDDN